jgi:hypothetical protein
MLKEWLGKDKGNEPQEDAYLLHRSGTRCIHRNAFLTPCQKNQHVTANRLVPGATYVSTGKERI